MELYALQVLAQVAAEKSFSRAAEKLFRTQPAVSLAVQRLESELGEKLIDRGGREVLLTDAGKLVLDYARRFENLHDELEDRLAELRDNSAGRLVIGANESTALYLLTHVVALPPPLPEGEGAGAAEPVEQDPVAAARRRPGAGRHQLQSAATTGLASKVIYTDHLAFVVSPRHRLAGRKTVAITELGMENFIAHNVVSPYRAGGAADVRAPQGAAAHGRRDAHRGDHPEAGPAQRGRGVPAADVRRAGSRAEHGSARCTSRS